MKNGILVCAGEGVYKNIGDYIQSVAQEQFFDKIDYYVEREHLDTFVSAEQVNLILNGWFMQHPENFPPSNSINPLFVSFHITPRVADALLSNETIKYLKRYEPIGARDLQTKELLESKGIKSYFSGCLTLTLGIKYKSEEKDGSIYFVDPYFDFLTSSNIVSKIFDMVISLFKSVKYRKVINKIIPNFEHEFLGTKLGNMFPKTLKRILIYKFYKTYSTAFSDDLLFNAKYITHKIKHSGLTNEDKMTYAKELITKYSKAKMVVTSRIHCGLPCIGIETPVIFVNSEYLKRGIARSGGRFGGLLNLFHCLELSGNKLVAKTDNLKQLLNKSKITLDTIIENSNEYLTLKTDLMKKCNSFIKQCNNQ